MNTTHTYYEVAQNNFWTTKGNNLTVVGDYLGRLPSIEILNPAKGEVILDAGCGAGFIARRVARAGATVFGCDRNASMLEAATEEEDQNPLGITYAESDISKSLPYPNNFFDKVACIAVLIHDSPEECLSFLREAKRVLKHGGRVIISIMHANLYREGSATRTGKASWVQYRPMETKPMSVSQIFEETYRDSVGQVFISPVWYHPETLFPRLFGEVGLEVVSEHHQYLTKDVLEACNQTGDVGYRAFYQILGKN